MNKVHGYGSTDASSPTIDGEYASIHSGHYRVATAPWEGPDFSRVCWIFPGQGSGAPGMFEREFRSEPVFRARLAEADALAKARGLSSVADYVFGVATEGEAVALLRILALFTSSVAVAEFLQARSRLPEVATAFSFGETSALTSLGVVSFAEMFEFVCRREEFCPPASTVGRMIAVSGDPAAIAAALGECAFHVSNLATPTQTVITVGVADLATAQKALRRARLAARALKDVLQPYHTPWLAETAARLAAYMREHPPVVRPLRVPFFSSVLQRLIPAGAVTVETVVDVISRQLIVPVDFVRQIRAIRAAGVCGFIEVGPGEVCSRFVEDILPAAERRVWPLARFLPAANTVETRETMAFELTPARNRLLGGLARAISRLTGYEITSIAVENRFQEDLGIDSIKKADILFTVVREAELPGSEDLNVSSIRTVAEAVQFLERQKDAPAASALTAATAAEFFRMVWTWQPAPLSPTTVSPALEAARGKAKPSRPMLAVAWRDMVAGRGVAKAREFLAGLGDLGGDVIVFERGEAGRGDPVEELLAAMKWLREHVGGFTGPRLNLALATCDVTSWEARAFGAFLKSLTKEMPAVICRCVQFDVWPGDERAVASVRRELDAEGPVEVRFEGGVRWAGRLVRCEPPKAIAPLVAPVVIAFGGARGITQALLRALAAEWRGARLHVVGRTTASEAGIAGALAELRIGSVEVEYHALDAADGGAVAGVFAAVHAREGRIDLVLNGAGIERSSLLVQKSEADLRAELAGKLEPARAIFAAARRWTPARLIHFSSAAARFGNAGQTVYALASQAIDELASDFSRSVPGCVVTSIHWPAWDGVGMTAAPGVRLALLRSGVPMLPAAAATALFREELSTAQIPGAVVDYFAPRDAWGFELGLRDLRALAPLIGKRHGLAGFERVFDLGADAFLRDHSLDGRAYLPAAFGVAMCHALASETGHGRLLEDFQMHAPVVVGDAPAALTFRGGPAADGRLRLIGGTSIDQFSCVVPEHDAARTVAIKVPAAPRRVEEIEPASLYRPEAFFHGPAFQVLHAIWSGESGALVAEMEAGRLPPIVGLARWDRIVQAIDGCFQVLALEGLLKHRVMALPTAIGSARFAEASEWPRVARFVTANVGLEDGSLTGDVVVGSADGVGLFELKGIRMRVLRAEVTADVRKRAVG